MKNLKNQYGTEKQCLEAVFLNRYGKRYECPQCHLKGKWYLIDTRKRFDCQCGHSLYPLSGTIFHKSETPLTLWFYAIYLFAQSKNGVSAKELERHLGVTYKTAWRIAKQIRLLFAQDGVSLSGTVETDETYVGGIKRGGKRGRGSKKTIVFGIVQRKGKVKAQVVQNIRRATLQPIITSSVQKGTAVMTDELPIYRKLGDVGYQHQTVKHKDLVFVRGEAHTNSVEGFWSQLKRSLDGTHHAVSPKHLQTYVDEFVWRYNRRGETLFPLLVAEVAKRSLSVVGKQV
jgi:transposase